MLVIALIMMAVIAISSAAAIKGAMTQDQIGSNQRAASVAMQAAESALRFCEALVFRSDLTAAQGSLLANIQEESVDSSNRWWQDIANWEGGTPRAFTLPTTFQFAAGTFNRRPQCLIERVGLNAVNSSTAPGPEVFIITARGFSPDYIATNNVPTRGSVVWLQSTVQIKREF